MSVTVALVKELREKSGAGMMDCKKALGETEGDMDAAIDWLRTKGLAAQQKNLVVLRRKDLLELLLMAQKVRLLN